MRVASVLDVLAENAYQDCAVVLPSLDHALYWWPILIGAYRLHHGKDWIVTTKTAIVSRKTHRALRLWVPYRLDPTMPMDWERLRRGMRMLDLYGLYGRKL